MLVRPGGRIPVDGEIVDGRKAVDEAPVTGESVPKTKGLGDMVFAGTINFDTALRIKFDSGHEVLVDRASHVSLAPR